MGFYCATAFATVIGQTGDWDILSAAVAVAVVEGIGALMYKVSVPLLDRSRNLIAIFNYWKAGLTMGLFLDSFKYEISWGIAYYIFFCNAPLVFLYSNCLQPCFQVLRYQVLTLFEGRNLDCWK